MIDTIEVLIAGRAGRAAFRIPDAEVRCMPLYEYECSKCGDRFEIIQKFSDDPVRVHSENGGTSCDGTVRKLLAAPAIQFKGSGWYVTDYGKGGKKPPSESAESGEKKSAKSSESKSDSSAAKNGSSSSESKKSAKS